MQNSPLDYFESEDSNKQKDNSHWLDSIKKVNLYVFPSLVFLFSLWQIFFYDTNEPKLETFGFIFGFYLIWVFLITAILHFLFNIVHWILKAGDIVPLKEYEDSYITFALFLANLVLLIGLPLYSYFF